MSAVQKEIASVQVTSCKASEQPWVSCNENVQAKVLSVDVERHSVEFMFKIAAGFQSGFHRHTCETSVLILEGRVKNHTTGVEFGPGDFCYQPYDDEHVEEFLEETIVYGSYRGTEDKLVEVIDESGNVTEEFKVSDFAAMLPQ
ncbi:MAG: anti-sigma factor ChrR (cupin superfamily) [Gammaproteobacteria bacterium]|jgi:anti-sigma factor ChrR (cupin superfamily)